jgi:hypothetical protein
VKLAVAIIGPNEIAGLKLAPVKLPASMMLRATVIPIAIGARLSALRATAVVSTTMTRKKANTASIANPAAGVIVSVVAPRTTFWASSGRPRPVATPEMPEIAEAQAVLAALAETDEAKVEAAHRQRLTQLHAAYGNALTATRGYGAPETTEAFARARESASGDKGAPGRLSADYGLWVGSFSRGELGAMRELSATMLRDCERRPQSGEASVAHRMRGVTHWFAGEFVAARGHLEQAAAIFDPERDGDLAFRFGLDPGVVAMAYLAQVLWLLGEVGLAGQRMKETTARGEKRTCHDQRLRIFHGRPVRALQTKS